MRKNKLLLRTVVFIEGLFLMSLGVALSVKANLGLSPISCIPFVFSLETPLTLGMLTVLFNSLFILGQMILLRKKYRLVQLVQLPVVFVFGVFIDFSVNITAGIMVPNYAWQVFYCLLGCVLMALGVFLEVKTDITYLPGEGLALAISKVFRKEFGKAKIGLDSSMVIIGIISSFVMLHKLQGIREGTVTSAVLVGFMAKFFSSKFHILQIFLKLDVHQDEITDTAVDISRGHFVITISREYGSGGHEIGRILADRLGISFYDKNLIEITAKQSGFTADYIRENEQKLSHSLLFELYEQNYAYINKELPSLDILFLVQSKIIRDICSKESCVIIGRCANFILKDNPDCFSVFIHADRDYRKTRISAMYDQSHLITDNELDKKDRERANYCLHYTGRQWNDSANYNLTINSSRYNINKAIDIIENSIQDLKHV